MAPGTDRARGEEREARPIRFMTFNVRFDTILDEAAGNRWEQREESVVETVRRAAPAVVGFQEALKAQLEDLIAAFPEYHALGKPREAGETGEYVPLFVLRERIEVEEHGDFWLSSTPETEGSLGWDADAPRHCTWAKVRERKDGRRFAVFNTHLDRWGVVARLEASRLIVTRVALAPDLPSVVMGDFNAEEVEEPLETLRAAGFRDTFRDVHPDAEDVQTVHHYSRPSGARKIDYVMCDRRWRVKGAEIVREPAAGRLPSDHFPVVADLVPDAA